MSCDQIRKVGWRHCAENKMALASNINMERAHVEQTGLHLESVGGRSGWIFSSQCMSQADLSAAAAVASGCCAPELLLPLLALAAKGQLQLFKSCGASVYTNPTEWCPRLGCDKTGGRMWFASAIFIDHLCSPACSLLSHGTRVCELGAGCGSVGLALNFKLGCDVTLTDVPEQLPLLHLNVGLNINLLSQEPRPSPWAEKRCSTRIPTVSALTWGDAEEASSVLAAAPGRRFDVILGCDITYGDADHLALLASMTALAYGAHDGEASSAPAVVLLACADYMQPNQPHSRFLRNGWMASAEALGWQWQVLRTVHEAECEEIGRRLMTSNGGDAVSDTAPIPVVILLGTLPLSR